MLWDLLQQSQISQARHAAGSANARAASAADASRDAIRETKRLRTDVDKLSLACMAMWQMLKMDTGRTDDDLLRLMQAIDESDGTADGRFTPPPQQCGACNRTTVGQRTKCMYCGEPFGADSPF